jgi:hypothetical protein
MSHGARLIGRGLSLRRVAAALALVGTSALPTSADPASAATASPTGSFAAITCPTATTCFAAGSYGDTQHKYLQPLVGRLANGKWTLTRAPVPNAPPDTSRGSLSGVACPTPKLCFAVGAYDTDYGAGVHNRTLIEQWNGSRWTIASRIRPADSARSALLDVECPSPRLCFAVGQWDNVKSGRAEVLLLQWNGKMWSIRHAPHPPPKAIDSGLAAITCSSGTSCFAVGTYSKSKYLGQSLVQQWNGRGWAVVGSPNPPKPNNQVVGLTGVSCASATSCLAVGHGGTSGEDATPTPLSLRWTGARWVIVSTPTAPRYSLYALNGVACPAGNACLSVGTTYVYDPHTFVTNARAHAERWNGARWSEASPGGTTPPLAAIECRTANDCIAGGGSSQPVVARWNGSAWAAAPVPVAFGPG